MSRIRPFRPGDEPALADICVRTADSGKDATGILDDDAIWAEIFVLPYVARHPEYAFVVEDDDGGVVGYIVGAPDTDVFEEWFRTRWWPVRAVRWPTPAGQRSRQDAILGYASRRRAGAEPYGRDHPAHLHIDLLPEAQGQGWGRQLIDTLADALRTAGVTGLHLVAADTNVGALAFYPKAGFERLESHPGVQAFAKRL